MKNVKNEEAKEALEMFEILAVTLLLVLAIALPATAYKMHIFHEKQKRIQEIEESWHQIISEQEDERIKASQELYSNYIIIGYVHDGENKKAIRVSEYHYSYANQCYVITEINGCVYNETNLDIELIPKD